MHGSTLTFYFRFQQILDFNAAIRKHLLIKKNSAPQLWNGFLLSSFIKNFHLMFFSLDDSYRLLFSVFAFLMLLLSTLTRNPLCVNASSLISSMYQHPKSFITPLHHVCLLISEHIFCITLPNYSFCNHISISAKFISYCK